MNNMKIFEFDKTLYDRLNEGLAVLSWSDQMVPASQVRSEWAAFIELQVEPVGWQALWKIPRLICEEFHIRFPTVVFGTVEQVIFKELKAIFVINAVQDDIHLPENHEVHLVDLYPTVEQDNNDTLNVLRTAESIDALRFFYKHVWMPWDNDTDDDQNWAERNLESRIRFCYALRKCDMKRALVAHIRSLLTEADYIQQRREYLQMDMSDDEEDLENPFLSDLMRMNLRLTMIKSEIEMLENPDIRQVYQKLKFDDEKSLKDHQICDDDDESGLNSLLFSKIGAAPKTLIKLEKNHKRDKMFYIVGLHATLEKQIQLLQLAKEHIPKDEHAQLARSLQDVLSICDAHDDICLSPGNHNIQFLEYLNNGGTILGLIGKHIQNAKKALTRKDVVILSPNDDSILMSFDGDFTLKDVTLDCRNVRTGMQVKNGKVLLKGCRMIGDKESSTKLGIICSGNAVLTLEDCIIEDFSTAIVLEKDTSLIIKNSKIVDCCIGLDINDKNTKLNVNELSISGAKKCGILIDSLNLTKISTKYLKLKQLSDIKKHAERVYAKSWAGICNFDECATNIYIINRLEVLVDDSTLDYILENDKEYLKSENEELPSSKNMAADDEETAD